MSALAVLLKNEGAEISGSDTEEIFQTEKVLEKIGVESELFSADRITPDIDLIIYTPAYGPDNPERARGERLNIKVISYGEALSLFAEGKKVIVITGTHGKTTTTAILGQIFEAGGLSPSVLIGDTVKAWGSSALAGKSDYFIVEGDEYMEKFRLFKPVGIIIPSLDYDHPDYFKDKVAYLKSFKDFMKENKNAKFVSTDEIFDKLGIRGETFGEEEKNIFNKSEFIFPGEAYRSNCLLAIKMSRIFGISDENIIKGISNFRGVGRRLDTYSKPGDPIFIVYDYAHHPVEIKSTINALKSQYPEHTIVAIFQPHTYSRTKALLDDFAQAFQDTYAVFFDEIYSSQRETKGEVSIEDLIIKTHKKSPRVYRLRDFEIKDLKHYASKLRKPLMIFMGAGDVWKKAEKLSSILSEGENLN